MPLRAGGWLEVEMLPLAGDLGNTSSLHYFEYILCMGRVKRCGRATWGPNRNCA